MKKKVNRVFVFGVISIFLVVLMSSFVFAAEGDVGYQLGGELAEFARNIGEFIQGFSVGISGEDGWGQSGAEILTTLLFAALLYMIVYSILTSTLLKTSGPLIKAGVTSAITLLALIGLPANFLDSIAVSYGAMGASILVVIPFLIVAAFTTKTGSLFVGKLTWVAFSCYFLGIYIQRVFTEETLFSAANIPNVIGVVIGIVAFFVLPFVRNAVFKGDLKGKIEKVESRVAIHKALKEVRDEEAKAEGLTD